MDYRERVEKGTLFLCFLAGEVARDFDGGDYERMKLGLELLSEEAEFTCRLVRRWKGDHEQNERE